MEFPSSIHSPKLIGSAGLIARYEARTITEQPAIVLVAPSAQYGAVSLDAAHKALVVLRQDGLPLAGCPSIIDYQETPDDGALLALGVRGAPLALNWPDDATEVEVLELAVQQVRLLAALHQAGFSGLQPGFDDLRWDSTHRSLMVLGWEWVRENDESRREDLQAAAALWVELLTGAAPPVFPPLTPETKGPAWQRVSLRTRALLSSILLDAQAMATAESTHTQLEAILRNWSQPVDELLSEGLDLLASEQFAAAQALLDLAARRDPDSVGSFRLRQSQERATKRFVEIIGDIRIGSYYSAVNKLQRIQTDGATTVQERLRAWRWWTIAEALERLEPGDQLDSSERLGLELLETGLDLDRGQVKAALNRVQRILAEEERSRMLDALVYVEADLRSCLLIDQATNLVAKDLTTAADLYEQAERDLRKLPEAYHTVFAAQFGDPAIGLEQARQKLASQELLRRTINEAKAALKANDLALARQKWNDALRLMDRMDSERATIRQELHRVQLRSQAVAAGVTSNAESQGDAAISSALQTLSALRSAFPRDTWGTKQAERWRQALVVQLQEDSSGPAGAWLMEYWGKDPQVRAELDNAAASVLGRWKDRLDQINNGQIPVRPSALEMRISDANDFATSIRAARVWIVTTTLSSEIAGILEQTRAIIASMTAQRTMQIALRQQLESALERRAPVGEILRQAAEADLELYDAPELSVTRLRERHADSRIHMRGDEGFSLGALAGLVAEVDARLVEHNDRLLQRLDPMISASLEAHDENIRRREAERKRAEKREAIRHKCMGLPKDDVEGDKCQVILRHLDEGDLVSAVSKSQQLDRNPDDVRKPCVDAVKHYVEECRSERIESLLKVVNLALSTKPSTFDSDGLAEVDRDVAELVKLTRHQQQVKAYIESLKACWERHKASMFT